MALTLTSTIAAADNVIAVTGTVPGNIATGFLFSLENEILRLKGFQGVLPPFPYPVNKQSWRVERGVNGTVSASHVSTTELFAVRDAWVKAANLTPPGPFPASGASTASEVEVSPAVEGESDVQGALTALATLVVVRQQTTEVNSAQLLASNATPITVVTGVANKVILPLAWALIYDYGTIAYAHSNEGFSLGWPDTLGAMFSTNSFGWFDGTTADGIVLTNALSGSGGGVLGALAGNVGAPLKMYATADPTNGDGTMTVVVQYALIAA